MSVVASDGSGRSASLDGDISEFEQAGPPVIILNEAGQSPFMLLCEHASLLLPMGYGRLGLASAEFDRHIAWVSWPITRLTSSRMPKWIRSI